MKKLLKDTVKDCIIILGIIMWAFLFPLFFISLFQQHWSAFLFIPWLFITILVTNYITEK